MAGRLVVVLGAGVNRKNGTGGSALPELPDVAAYLAERFDCPPEHARSLARISEYVALTKGIGLSMTSCTRCSTTTTNQARHIGCSPRPCLCSGTATPRPLIVTTNFDVALERAFTESGEPFDVVSYLALGRRRGSSFMSAPMGTPLWSKFRMPTPVSHWRNRPSFSRFMDR